MRLAFLQNREYKSVPDWTSQVRSHMKERHSTSNAANYMDPSLHEMILSSQLKDEKPNIMPTRTLMERLYCCMTMQLGRRRCMS